MMTPLTGGRITATFDEMRPLSVPPAQRIHPHGALDLAGGDGIIRAPTRGTAQGFVIIRGRDPRGVPGEWGGPGIREKSEILEFPWRNYWDETYGGIIVLIEPSGRTHLFAHILPTHILNPQPGPARYPFRFAYYIEEREDTRYLCRMLLTEPREVNEGQPLAPVGYAGYVVPQGPGGRHVHWEIHHQADRLDDYPLRINPEEYLK